MAPFTRLTAVAIPILRDNIDTDAIIPSREITAVSKVGLADGLFAGWRYAPMTTRVANPHFVMNDPAYHGAQILLTGANFGCGSSREHAVWALAEHGFRVLVASSFNAIFFRNCLRNGLLPCTLTAGAIREIAALIAVNPQTQLVSIDLENQTCEAGHVVRAFDIAPDAKEMLLQGLDEIDRTWRFRPQIQAFQAEDRRKRPWAYP